MKPQVAVTILALIVLPAAGCADAREPEPATRPEKDIACTAKLQALEPEYLWFEDSGARHSDGESPLAAFVISKPAEYADRSVRILFKYGPSATVPAAPEESDIGSSFAFELPEAFLGGGFKTIDNDSVRQFRRVTP